MAKSASGALELIPYIQITNLADALEELHKLGFVSIGLDSEGPAPLEGTFSGEKIALVLGSEGKGLRQKTRADRQRARPARYAGRDQVAERLECRSDRHVCGARLSCEDDGIHWVEVSPDRQSRFGTAIPELAPGGDIEFHFAPRQVGDVADPDAGGLAEFEFRAVAISAGTTGVRRRCETTRQEAIRQRPKQASPPSMSERLS